MRVYVPEHARQVLLCLIGPPASGKGTQAGLLAENFGFRVFGTGDKLRELGQDGRDGQNTAEKIVQPLILEAIHAFSVSHDPVLVIDSLKNGEQMALAQKEADEHHMRLCVFGLTVEDLDALESRSISRRRADDGKIRERFATWRATWPGLHDAIRRLSDEDRGAVSAFAPELVQDPISWVHGQVCCELLRMGIFIPE